jgi:hypothetical protein
MAIRIITSSTLGLEGYTQGCHDTQLPFCPFIATRPAENIFLILNLYEMRISNWEGNGALRI